MPPNGRRRRRREPANSGHGPVPIISLSIASRSYIGLWDRARDTMTTIDEIRDNFALLDEWDDRYRYVIELGRTLDPMPEAEHSAANKVQGCASQVWLSKQIDRSANGEPRLNYLGDSDAHIVRGLIAILLTLYSGHTPQEILATDAPRGVRRIRLSRAPDAAAFQRPARDGRAHSRRRPRGACRGFLENRQKTLSSSSIGNLRGCPGTGHAPDTARMTRMYGPAAFRKRDCAKRSRSIHSGHSGRVRSMSGSRTASEISDG